MSTAEISDSTGQQVKNGTPISERNPKQGLIPECIVCRGKTATVYGDIYDLRYGISGCFTIVRCQNCGLKQTAPRLDDESLLRLYERYYNFRGYDINDYARTRQRFVRSIFYSLWTRADGDISFTLLHGLGRRLLDVGCNEGRNLTLYSRRGFAAEGLETNSVAAQAARSLGHRVHSMPLALFDPGYTFDVIVLSNVLEHVSDPLGMLRDARRVLSPEGTIWISCPNANSFACRLFRTRWINWHPPFHLTHFDTQTLTGLLSRAGLVVTSQGTCSPSLWIAQSLIAAAWYRPGCATRKLRQPLLVGVGMTSIRALAFPLLWHFNRRDQGDCLLVTARSALEQTE